MNNSEKVKVFTEESRDVKCPLKPEVMTKEEVKFIIRMVFSEMQELALTVCDYSKEGSINFLQECLNTIDCSNMHKANDKTELIAQQFDAFVDAEYYMKNCAAKKGVNLDKIFDLVHEANMNKRFEDGKFHRREDGKVIKPDGWQEPDIVGEIRRQENDGAWL